MHITIQTVSCTFLFALKPINSHIPTYFPEINSGPVKPNTFQFINIKIVYFIFFRNWKRNDGFLPRERGHNIQWQMFAETSKLLLSASKVFSEKLQTIEFAYGKKFGDVCGQTSFIFVAAFLEVARESSLRFWGGKKGRTMDEICVVLP